MIANLHFLAGCFLILLSDLIIYHKVKSEGLSSTELFGMIGWTFFALIVLLLTNRWMRVRAD